MLNKVIEIVRECGKMILNAQNIENQVDEKSGAANFVTVYDKAIEEYLKEKLLALLPEAHFLGEEGSGDEDIRKGYSFIVDPIDGTTNFIKHYGHSAVSVGMAYNGEPVLGVVYNPYLDDMFYAEKGKGAWLNGKPIKVSSHELKDGIFIFGSTPYFPETADITFSVVRKLFSHALDCRRTASAALDMCYVACGRCELYFEVRVSPWDYAGAYVILSEAGGVSSTMLDEKEPLPYGRSTSVVAGNEKSFRAYWDLIGKVL